MQSVPPEDARPGQASSRSPDLLDALWRWGSAPALGLALAGLGLLFLLAALAVPQAPADAQSNPAAYARWVAALTPVWRGCVVWLERLGLHRVFAGDLFRLYLSAVGLHLLLGLGEGLSRAWRGWRWARRAAAGVAAPTGLEASGAAPSERLWWWGWARLGRAADGAEVRWRIPWGAVLYLGLGVTLAGSLWGGRMGWSMDPFPLPPERLTPLAAGHE
ncbi:MAG: hypothetical protein GX605_06635, partial [Chloroflexi bacterium]|nr:hypothetical protein [Chloroflexota bacterium]